MLPLLKQSQRSAESGDRRRGTRRNRYLGGIEGDQTLISSNDEEWTVKGGTTTRGKETVSKEVVFGPVPAASVDPRSTKAAIETTKPQPSSRSSKKRKFSQTVYWDNLRVAVIDRDEPEGKISESR